MNEGTFIACLTPPGRAAIATLTVRGPHAWKIVRESFEPLSGQLPSEAESGRFRLGRLAGAEVVLAVREDAIELHCHGGAEIVAMLLEVFAERGIQVCSWQEMDRRTSNGPSRSLAQAALVQAPTVRTAAILLDQYHGAFSKALETIISSAEKVGFDELTERISLGRHLIHPWQVVIAGAPNVGKSSLVNTLAGFQRSIVASKPGTTRDVVTTLLAIDGWPVELADTAGWRNQADMLEAEGIARAQAAAKEADLCLWLVDGSSPPVLPELKSPNLRLVINKVDLPAAWTWEGVDALQVSAKTGAGLTELCQNLSRWLVPNPPEPGTAVPFTPSICQQIEEIREHFSQGRSVLALEELRGLLTNPPF
jgi:tRNA modification GTPase